ncbi:sporulation protein YqfD [Ectobacillus polymachus]|uniref:sporulation protein YqfD n=1 Tax=Ectobacillus polymachus TaxID=1508806 RepID=UPI003A88F25B
MKNHWIVFFFGYVKVSLRGKGIERLLNDCVRKNIKIWNVKKLGEEHITLYMSIVDVKRLRFIVRKHPCKVFFLGRYGLPFWQKRLLRNSGFAIGFVLCLSLIFLLSNMVWTIEIKGAKPDTEYLLIKELEKMGIKRGKLQFQLPDIETIQRTLTNNVNSVTWIGVEQKGTSYQFQVVEKNEPKKEDTLAPRNLVAKKEAVITKIFIEEGKPLVAVNDRVEKGQLLVTGTYGKEDSPVQVPAKGVVLGETWYESQVEVPIKTTFQVFTGQFLRKHYLILGNVRMPLWGFEKNTYKQYKEEVYKYHVHFFAWTLPVSYEKVTIREEEAATREYTEKQAIDAGIAMAREDVKKKLDENSSILSEKVLHKIVENGTLKLSLYFKAIENIVATEPITESNIQGD